MSLEKNLFVQSGEHTLLCNSGIFLACVLQIVRSIVSTDPLLVEHAGIMKYINGDVYQGQWKDNKRHGTGEFPCDCCHEEAYAPNSMQMSKQYLLTIWVAMQRCLSDDVIRRDFEARWRQGGTLW